MGCHLAQDLGILLAPKAAHLEPEFPKQTRVAGHVPSQAPTRHRPQLGPSSEGPNPVRAVAWAPLDWSPEELPGTERPVHRGSHQCRI